MCGIKNTCNCLGALSHFHPGSPRTGGLALRGGGEGLAVSNTRAGASTHSILIVYRVFTPVQSTNSIFSQTHRMNRRWKVLSLGTLDYASNVSRVWIWEHVVWSHFSVYVCPSPPGLLRWTPGQHSFPTLSLTLLCLEAQMMSKGYLVFPW